jgi:hypothetical protein
MFESFYGVAIMPPRGGDIFFEKGWAWSFPRFCGDGGEGVEIFAEFEVLGDGSE